MTILEFVLIAFATWRITSLIVAEDGPFGIFERIRRPFIFLDPDKLPPIPPTAMRVHQERTGFGSTLFRCIWCMSAYVAPIVWALWFYVPYANYVVIAFAISGAAIIIEAFSGGSKDHM